MSEPSDDPQADLDEIEQKAAILQYGDGLTRYMAELQAAKERGYKNWIEARMKIKQAIKKGREG
jgi:hypothetical protein